MPEKNRKLFFIFSFIFLFIISFSFISANAVFNTIPARSLSTLMEVQFNLNTYCYSNAGISGCADSSYALQFINPDTSQSVFLFPNSYNDNSYFRISLGSNGIVNIQSKLKNLNNFNIIVRGADVPLSSQTSTSFILNINSITAPIQKQSLGPLILSGNETVTYAVSNLFSNYNAISVSYSDNVLAQSIFLKISTGSQCSTGAIKVCLTGSEAGNSYITISGQNISYFGKIGITAYNSAGQTSLSNNGLSLTVNPYTINIITSPPFRNPFSVAPLSMGFNEIRTLNLDDMWSNYTYINATFINPDTANNVTVRLGVINGTIYSDSFNTNSVFTISLTNFLYPTVKMQVTSKETSASFPVFLSACNNGGCDSTFNVEWVFINGTLPTATPISIAPIIMSTNSLKNFDLTHLFSNFDSLKITFEDINSRDTAQGIDSKNSVKLNETLNIMLNGSSYDFGTVHLQGGDFSNSFNSPAFSGSVSTSFHYLIKMLISSGNLTINGDTVLEAPTPVSYENYQVNSNDGEDLNFSATGDAIIYSIALVTDYVIVTLPNDYSILPASATNFNTSSIFIVNVTNSTGYNYINQTSIAFPVYFFRLYENGILSINSGDTPINVYVSPSACNSVGCIGGTSLNNIISNFSILFKIVSDTNPELSQINNSAIAGAVSGFLGLYPPADTLSAREKIFYVIISMLIITVIIFVIGFFIFKSQSALPLVYISGILNAILFIFFIAIGYIATVIWITGILIIAVLIFFKLFGGKG